MHPVTGHLFVSVYLNVVFSHDGGEENNFLQINVSASLFKCMALYKKTKSRL